MRKFTKHLFSKSFCLGASFGTSYKSTAKNSGKRELLWGLLFLGGRQGLGLGEITFLARRPLSIRSSETVDILPYSLKAGLKIGHETKQIIFETKVNAFIFTTKTHKLQGRQSDSTCPHDVLIPLHAIQAKIFGYKAKVITV